jgi:hypothetical protein
MTSDLDRLPPDQRAVLSLVLTQDKSYADVASMLGLPEQSVRDRAHAALDALAGQPQPMRTAARSSDTATSNGHPPVRPRPSSKLGGALLLGAIVAAAVVAAILISGGGKGSGRATSATSQSANGSATTGGSGASGAGGGVSSSGGSGAPKVDKVLALTPVESSLKARGAAYVFSQKGRHAFYVVAQGMPASQGFFYAVWLYNSSTSAAPLGRAPAVTSSGRMEGGGPLPPNAAAYHRLVVTRETDPHAAHPGEIVMIGAFALH